MAQKKYRCFPGWFAALCMLVFLGAAFPVPARSAGDDELSLEDLLFMDLPEILTASKHAEALCKAPSVVYVVTAQDIKRSGARSLAEVLKRVPGMHISLRESSLLGSRGFTSDQNDKFVFLIDGTPITNIMQDGAWGFLDMPNLAMVEKIEIVKGPGSTLWGSDASLGIINVFTKKGEQVGGTQLTADYATQDDWGSGNVLYGNKTAQGDYLVSLTYTDSKGFANTPEGWNRVYFYGGETPNTAYGAGANSRGNRMLEFQPSIELYTKVRQGDLVFKTRGSYERMGYLWGTDYDSAHQDIVFKHFYTEVEKEKNTGLDTTVTTKLNVHALSYDRGVKTQSVDPAANRDLETKSEMGLSAERIFSTTLGEIHRVIAGIKAMSVQFGPSTRQNYMVASTSTTLNGGYPVGYKYVYVTEANLDNTIGVYVEDSISADDNVTLVGGISYEYNDLRETGGQVMPRAALIFQHSEAVTSKYTYNTGYNRPPVDKKFHKMFGHVEKSEKVEEHDVQLAYNTSTTRVTLTGFHYMLFDYFTWQDFTTTTGIQGHFNAGDAKSDGFELDMRHNVTRSLAVYGNLMYANTKINNADPAGEPREVYNAGLDYYYTPNVSLNVNMNGAAEFNNGGVIVWGDSQQLLDAALVIDTRGSTPLTLTLYTQNMLDTKAFVGMTGWPGWTNARGATYGVKIACKL